MEKRHSLIHGMTTAACTQPWQAMEGDDRTRTCPHCHNQVFRVDGLSETELAALIVSENSPPITLPALYRRLDGNVMLVKDSPGAPCRGRTHIRRIADIALGVVIFLAIYAAGKDFLHVNVALLMLNALLYVRRTVARPRSVKARAAIDGIMAAVYFFIVTQSYDQTTLQIGFGIFAAIAIAIIDRKLATRTRVANSLIKA